MTKPFSKYDLTGKRALITGAAGLLGVQHAAALLEAGAAVVLTDVSEDGLKRTSVDLRNEFQDAVIDTMTMDVSRQSAVQSVADQLQQAGKRVDILVNNAAIDHKVKASADNVEMTRLEVFTLEQWNAEIAVGLTGAFICGQIFGSAMANDGKGGVILNVASDLSISSPDQRLYRIEGRDANAQPVKPVTYSVIKAGLVGLTRYLATYWSDKGVRANALSPGGVFNSQPDEFVKRISALIPAGRMAERDEYRSAVQFLCSDASSYMNGQNVVMDGGRSVW